MQLDHNIVLKLRETQLLKARSSWVAYLFEGRMPYKRYNTNLPNEQCHHHISLKQRVKMVLRNMALWKTHVFVALQWLLTIKWVRCAQGIKICL